MSICIMSRRMNEDIPGYKYYMANGESSEKYIM